MLRLFITPFLFLYFTPAFAQVEARPTPPLPRPDTLRMLPMEALQQSTIGEKLGNGSVANPRDWPATFSGRYSVGGREFACTSTLVAARVLLTGAHCIAQGGRVEIVSRDSSYFGTCTSPEPGYPEVQSADWALCLMDKPVSNLRYERVSIDSNLLTHNRQLLLTGFGCTLVGGIADGKFRTGPAFIEWLPGQLTDQPNWLATYAAAQRSDAFICEGDSGGAVYILQPSINRRLAIAVNSHRSTDGRLISYLSALSVETGRRFLEDWTAQTGQSICGMHTDASNCR